MKAWNHDPKKLLLMNLKLVKGVQFSNPLGEIIASIPNVLEATNVTKWQYRMMLSLDGEQQFVEVVKEVKNDYAGEFEATDVWMFLDWLVENNLVESDEVVAEAIPKFESDSTLPDVLEPSSSTHSWLKMPLQAVAIATICLFAAFGTYVATPFLLALLGNSYGPAPQEDVPVVFAEATPVVKEKSAVRTPKLAEPQEVTFASRATIKEELPPIPEGPSLVDQLIRMRHEMAACQILRDEYYLLNDEKGYRAEVAKISELVKEIGQIRADITE